MVTVALLVRLEAKPGKELYGCASTNQSHMSTQR